ncbi:MAG: hypothetical protein K2N81_09020 [Acetatifactor sp.]|nr:hypothetical protein [Acetatifactor sp.]
MYEIRDYPKTEAGVRTVFIPTEFSSIIGRLKLLCENEEYVFWTNGKNIKTLQIRKRLYLVCKEAGVRKNLRINLEKLLFQFYWIMG